MKQISFFGEEGSTLRRSELAFICGMFRIFLVAIYSDTFNTVPQTKHGQICLSFCAGSLLLDITAKGFCWFYCITLH